MKTIYLKAESEDFGTDFFYKVDFLNFRLIEISKHGIDISEYDEVDYVFSSVSNRLHNMENVQVINKEIYNKEIEPILELITGL